MKISVITPVYNRQDCILQCLESVETQYIPEGFEIEHVVVDNGSSDASPAIIGEYAASHPMVKAVALPHNRGTNAARNAAARAATGEWVLFLDSDDTMMPGAIDTLCQTLKSRPGFLHYLFAADHRTDITSGYAPEVEFSFADFLLQRTGGDFVQLFRRETMLSLPFDEELRIHEGVFFMRFFRHAKKILFTNKVIYHINLGRADHATYTLNLTNGTALQRRCKACDLMREFFEKDYIATVGGTEILAANARGAVMFHTLAGNYESAFSHARLLKQLGHKVPLLPSLLMHTRTGRPAWHAVKMAMKLKHGFLNRH